jgi:hypothetical protein
MLCVLTNTFAFPGLGTVMAKRPIGFVQVALTLLGFTIFMGFMLWFLGGLLRTAGDESGDLQKFYDLVKARAWIGGAGLGLVVGSWFWAILSSIGILRAARERRVPPPVP